MSDIIQSLWIGDSLSKLEQVCIKSFVDNGHEFHLYTYGPVKNIPEGVTVKDGNEILHESEIFRYKNGSVSAFSNLFRFTMLYKKGGYWVDTDVICVKPLNFTENYVFASETSDYKSVINTSFLIKIPINSDVAKKAMEIQREHKKLILTGAMAWGSGPKTINQIIKEFRLEKYVTHWSKLITCAWPDVNSLIDPNFKENKNCIVNPKNLPENMCVIHLWNEVWRRKNINKNDTFHPNSIIGYFQQKYLTEKF